MRNPCKKWAKLCVAAGYVMLVVGAWFMVESAGPVLTGLWLVILGLLVMALSYRGRVRLDCAHEQRQ